MLFIKNMHILWISRGKIVDSVDKVVN